jgi:hypothetical protein
MTRVIALGASNLTRGLRTVVSMSRAAWGPDTEVFATLGLGRSYGAAHTLLVRRLPGIPQSGLWRALDEAPPVPSIGIVSDVGNDVLYGFAPEQILEWVSEAVTRLQRHTDRIALTGLPTHNVDRLTERRFRIMRSFMFPSSHQTLAGARATALIVHAGLEQMAATRGLRFVRLQHEWYGWDPVHFRPRYRRRMWGECLGLDPTTWTAPPEPGGFIESARLWLRADEHRWLFGVHQHTPQCGRLRLY